MESSASKSASNFVSYERNVKKSLYVKKLHKKLKVSFGLLEGQINDLSSFSRFRIQDMSVGLESLHGNAMSDDVLNHLLGHNILHHTDESVSEAVNCSREITFLLQNVPVVSHGRLITLGTVSRAEYPLRF